MEEVPVPMNFFLKDNKLSLRNIGADTEGWYQILQTK